MPRHGPYSHLAHLTMCLVIRSQDVTFYRKAHLTVHRLPALPTPRVPALAPTTGHPSTYLPPLLPHHPDSPPSHGTRKRALANRLTTIQGVTFYQSHARCHAFSMAPLRETVTLKPDALP